MFHSFLSISTNLRRRLTAAGLPRQQARPRHTARLALEALEDRLAPATLTVNTLADNVTSDNFLSLREAVILVDGGSTGGIGRSLTPRESAQVDLTQPFGTNDTIRFDPSLTQSGAATITLTKALFLGDHANGVKIIGPGANRFALDGARANQIFVFTAGTSASLSGLTLQKGNAGVQSGGGGILNQGTLTIDSCTFASNRAATGAGIENQGTLTVTRSTFVNNQAASAGNAQALGGGIANDAGKTLNVSDCTFLGNSAVGGQGGGIFNAGTLSVVNSTFASNSIVNSGSGAGIETASNGQTTLVSTILSGNFDQALLYVHFKPPVIMVVASVRRPV